ncbi:MAG: hypothetical protein JOY70_04010 [Acidisphaera sp.]|nr:hypothetical protein [Acidisphaera sp.]MBV9811109.1 hypothetical protein [Acetobacteraceae bacterium]
MTSHIPDDLMPDDGLVHGHGWAQEPGSVRHSQLPRVANPEFLGTPSTTYQDDHVFPG